LRLLAALLLAALAACAVPPERFPPFAQVPYQPFSRAAVIAIALTEWRAFGAPVDDAPPETRPPPQPDAKPERQEGLWQHVGLYWWLGLNPGTRESRWTGKHDAQGLVFPPQDDDEYAWSAAFVSYVMRLAGAGPRFPYAGAHHVYINRAREVSLGRARGDWVVSAEPPDTYAPVPGDLICMSRTATPLTFADLPAGRFPAHCDIVVAREPDVLDVIGGNVDDAVTLKHVPVTANGLLADPRYPWFVVLRVRDPA